MNTEVIPKRKNTTLWLMLMVAVLPVIAAYLAFFTGIGVPNSTVNAGVMLKKAQSVEPLLDDKHINEFVSNKKWRLLLPIASACDALCEKNLYTSRQVHIRLDQKSKRLSRVALVVNGAISDSDIKKYQEEHPRLQFLSVSSQQWQTWSAELESETTILPTKQYYYLVDQELRAMMFYSSDIHGNDVLKDIKRALKFSIDYQ